MKIFTTGVLAVLLATLAPFSLHGQGASGSAELQDAPALKARVAELEADLVKMRQLKEENACAASCPRRAPSFSTFRRGRAPSRKTRLLRPATAQK